MRKLVLSVVAVALVAGPAVAQQEEEEPSRADRHARQILPFPIIISDPTNGTGAGGGVLLLYRVTPEDTISQDSQTSAFGYFTNTKSWKVGFDQFLSFKEDKFRVDLVARFGKVNNRFEYTELPSDVVYGERQDLLTTNFLYNVFWRAYVGVNYRFASTNFIFDQGSEEEQEFSETVLGLSGAQRTTDSGLGLRFAADSRPTQWSPTSGLYTELELLNFETWLGSDFDYYTLDWFTNGYIGLTEGHVLALRGRLRIGSGDVPFTGQATYGGMDLRGYPTGKYRGDGMVVIQAEYRFNIWARLGGVAFAGTGKVWGGEPTLGQNEVLPSAGGGVRFVLFKDRGTTVGLDYAWGEDGNRGLYFIFGEAF